MNAKSMNANLLLDSLHDLWEGFITRLPSIFTGLLVLLFFYIAARCVRYFTRKSLAGMKASEHAARLSARVSFVAVMVLGVLVSLGVMGIDAGALVASLGLVSVGIGFALKDVIENFIAGAMLIFQRPFMVGDVVCFGDVEGTVEDVRVRDTVIRMFDGREVFVPNASIFSTAVINYNRERRRRLDFEVSIAYAEDAAAATAVAARSLQGVDGIMREPPPLVVVEALGESAVAVRVYFWVNPIEVNVLEMKSAAITAVKGALDGAGIEIPFPIITVRPAPQQSEMP